MHESLVLAFSVETYEITQTLTLAMYFGAMSVSPRAFLKDPIILEELVGPSTCILPPSTFRGIASVLLKDKAE